jgi:hypothetical protein
MDEENLVLSEECWAGVEEFARLIGNNGIIHHIRFDEAGRGEIQLGRRTTGHYVIHSFYINSGGRFERSELSPSQKHTGPW